MTSLKKLIPLLLFSIIAAPHFSFAQEEDFADEEFDSNQSQQAPPPPGVFSPATQEETAPMAPSTPGDSTGRFGGGSAASSSSGVANPSFNTAKKRRKPIPFSEAQPEDINNDNYPDLIDSFDYPNAQIADVIKAISELTGRNFIVDPTISGTITIIAPTQITKAEAYKAFLSALAIRGYTVVPSGKFLKIRRIQDAKSENIQTYSGNYSPDTDQVITRIIHLKHISADEVNRTLKRILTGGTGDMEAYAPTNSLIVTHLGTNITRIMAIIKQLDVPGFEEKLQVIPIKNAKAKDVADLVDKIINKGDKPNRGGGAFSSGIPRFGAANTQGTAGAAYSLVIPDDRTNSIIVVGNDQGTEKIQKLVKQLDFPMNPEDSGGVYVYYMKHAEAKAIAEILSGIAKDQKQGQTTRGGSSGSPEIPPPVFRGGIPDTNSASTGGLFGADVKVSADETINSLVITASKQDYNAIKSLLAKLDIPRNQVHVEAVIMEISNRNKRDYGISTYKFLKTDKPTDAAPRIGFNGGNLDSLTNPAADQGMVLGWGSQDTVQVKIAGTQMQVPNLLSFLTFVQSVTDANIMSTPSITVLDNSEAEIEVGDTLPTEATISQGTGGAANIAGVKREPITLKLKIKPRISPGSEAVRLNIVQTIKQLSNVPIAAANLSANAIATSDRNLKTDIVVNNKDTAVMGGLIRESETIVEKKVPLLGDIPVLGWLFKSSSKDVEKRNLVMFITPNIIRTNEDAREIKMEKLTDRVDFIKRYSGGRDPFGRQAEKLSKNNGSGKADSLAPIEGTSSDEDTIENELQDETDVK